MADHPIVATPEHVAEQIEGLRGEIAQLLSELEGRVQEAINGLPPAPVFEEGNSPWDAPVDQLSELMASTKQTLTAKIEALETEIERLKSLPPPPVLTVYPAPASTPAEPQPPAREPGSVADARPDQPTQSEGRKVRRI